MDKIKNLLGGSNKEETASYDEDSYSQTATHTGKLTGEGSHLSSATGNPGTTSSDPTASTAGPHSSDLLNKADPRVDSNLGQGTAAGNSPDFASKAASTAWSSHNQSAPGAFPEEDHSNPYAATSIDPRVDKVPRPQDTSVGTGPTTSTTETLPSQTTDPGLGQSANAPAGFNEYSSGVGTGPSSDSNERSLAGRTPDTSSKVAEDYDNTASQASVPPTSTTSDTTGTTDNRSTIGKALGAIGLGGAAAKVDRETPSTTTGTDAYDTSPQSGVPTSSIIDPNSSDPNTFRKPETSPLGPDLGLRAPIGATGTGAASTYDERQDHSGISSGVQSGAPTSSTTGGHTAFYDAATTRHQPEAASSGIGSTGTSQGYGTTTSVLPDRSTSQEYGTTSSALPGTASSQEYGTTSDRHLGRDAAAVGVGAGTLGAGAYEHQKHQATQDTSTGRTPEYDAVTSSSAGTAGYQTTSQPYDQTGGHHLGHDTAAVGVGAGAAGVGAHEYSKHDAKEEKKLEKSERQHEKAMEKEEKHREKELAKEQKAHEHHSHRAEETAGAAGAGALGAHEYDEHDKDRKPSLIQRILHPRSSKTTEHEETSGVAASDAADRRAFQEHGDTSSRLGSGYAEAPSSGYASQVTGGTGTTALAMGGEPVNPSNTGEGALSGHQHGVQGSGLTRESMTGEPGSGHQFGEITDHKR